MCGEIRIEIYPDLVGKFPVPRASRLTRGFIELTSGAYSTGEDKIIKGNVFFHRVPKMCIKLLRIKL